MLKITKFLTAAIVFFSDVDDTAYAGVCGRRAECSDQCRRWCNLCR